MVGNLNLDPTSTTQFSILKKGSFKSCHVYLPGLPKPVGAIAYGGRYYSCVRFYTDFDSAQRGAQRLIERGNPILLTQVPKGLILWVFEPDAQVA